MSGDKEKILTIIDKETGEIEAHIKLADRTFGKQRWFALFQDYALKIAHSDLTGEQCKVLFYLFNKLDFDNYISVK